MSRAISAGKLQPTASAILSDVRTKTEEAAQNSRVSLLKNVVVVLRKTFLSYRSVAALTVLVFVGWQIYRKGDAQ
ncbi:MAG: hypothetical protein LBH53_03695 [Puniceicoccales bacterium]|jgi:hypothetical protein|nr:hypothetical protein [Puniceicoccales bacterium]